KYVIRRGWKSRISGTKRDLWRRTRRLCVFARGECPGEGNAKAGAGLGLRGRIDQFNMGVVLVCNLFNNGKPQAAAVSMIAPYAKEAVDSAVAVLGRNALARVFHFQYYAGVGARDTHRSPTARRGVQQGVIDKIVEQFGHHQAVSTYP